MQDAGIGPAPIGVPGSTFLRKKFREFSAVCRGTIAMFRRDCGGFRTEKFMTIGEGGRGKSTGSAMKAGKEDMKEEAARGTDSPPITDNRRPIMTTMPKGTTSIFELVKGHF